MATLAPPSPTRSPSRMPRRWARKCERYCCIGATYFPLFFVYSITTWAVWVEATIGFLPAKSAFTGQFVLSQLVRNTNCCQVPAHPSLASHSTSSSTGLIPQPFSQVRGLQQLEITVTALSQHRRRPSRRTSQSNQTGNYDSARNAKQGNRIVRIIARRVGHAC